MQRRGVMKWHELEGNFSYIWIGHSTYTVKKGEVEVEVIGVTADPATLKAFASVM